MTDLIERLRKFIATKGLMLPASEFEMLALVANELDRIVALEANAFEGERRGLERAAGIARSFAKEPARKLLAKNMNGRWPVTAKPLALQALSVEKAIRALIPEAPAQRELASSAANQLSGSRVGEPAREGNPEDHPRYPALLADAKARGRNENLDGSPRRHAVVREGE